MQKPLIATDLFDQSQIKTRLAPHYPLLWQIVMQPFADWERLRASEPAFRHLTHVGAAHWFHHQMVDVAKGLIEGHPDIKYRDVNGMFVFDVVDEMRFSIKKLHRDRNKRMVWSNYRTKTNREYYRQSLFPNDKPLLKLILGYELNEVMTNISLFVACPQGNQVSWAFRIPDQGSQFAFRTVVSPDEDMHTKKGFNVRPSRDAAEGRGS